MVNHFYFVAFRTIDEDAYLGLKKPRKILFIA